jgi:hypothetical protein
MNSNAETGELVVEHQYIAAIWSRRKVADGLGR